MNRLDTLLATRPAQARLYRFREMLSCPEIWNLSATDQDNLRWAVEFIEAALEERQKINERIVQLEITLKDIREAVDSVMEEGDQ